MAVYDGNVVFGGESLKITNLTPIKTQKTIKQVMGKSVAQVKIIGLNAQQWRLELSGHIFGTTSANLSSNRANLEALDVASVYSYTDGIHDGSYIIEPGSLKFKDSGDDANSKYDFSMRLLEW